MSCGVGCRHESDPAWLWLWCRLAAVAPIRPLAWEPPYAAGAALKRQKKKKKKKTQAVQRGVLPLGVSTSVRVSVELVFVSREISCLSGRKPPPLSGNEALAVFFGGAKPCANMGRLCLSPDGPADGPAGQSPLPVGEEEADSTISAVKRRFVKTARRKQPGTAIRPLPWPVQGKAQHRKTIQLVQEFSSPSRRRKSVSLLPALL